MDRSRESLDLSGLTKSLEDKATSIKKLVHVLELRLRGWKWVSDSDTYIDTGRDLAGEEVINKLIGLLQPFCEDSNLITAKKPTTFIMQRHEIDTAMIETLVSNIGCPAENMKVISKMFKTTLQNIGDIILSSRSFIQALLAGSERPEDKSVPM